MERSPEIVLAALLERGEPAVMATVIRTSGSPPSHGGAKFLVDASGPVSGGLGCSEFDAGALDDALQALQSGSQRISTYHHDLGDIEVYFDVHPGRPLLAVGGASNVAAALLHWGRDLGFRTALYESRPGRLLDAQRWRADADHVISDSEQLSALLQRSSCCVHTDHDSPDVQAFLEAAIGAEARFVGLMGSRRHTSSHLRQLKAHGLTPRQLARIRTPVGIDIGARSPQEIALSILAGVVAERSSTVPAWLDARSSGDFPRFSAREPAAAPARARRPGRPPG